MSDTSNPPNPEDLARLYMEFWRQNMAGLTRDPQVAEGIARLFDMMTAGASTFAQMMAAQGRPGAGKESRAAADESAQRLDQLTRRLAELERRVERLEPRARVRRTRAAPTRTRRPRRPT